MTYSLRMDAQLENLSAIRDFVEDIATRLNVAPAAIPNVVLAVDEMVTNIIIHGYQGQPGFVEIEVAARDDALIIQLHDQGPSFDPTVVPPPDLSVPFDERPPGGLGIYLTRKVMDEVHHHVTAAHGNELTLIKYQIIPSSAGGMS
jgi:anti-sigma regulatory factor (Ser/Thr protein kinase)